MTGLNPFRMSSKPCCRRWSPHLRGWSSGIATYAVVNEAFLQTRSRLINSNPDLMALQDGSFDLSAESVDEVAQNMLEFISQRLQLDRGGIFLAPASGAGYKGYFAGEWFRH